MNPKDVAVLLEAIQQSKRRVWTQAERFLMDLAKRAVKHDRWLNSKDSFALQAMYRKSQGGTI